MENVLFPHCEDRLKWDHHLTELLAEAEQRVALGPVTSTIDLDDLPASE